MASVLVMGASGYIGSHLVPCLIAAGHSVRTASRSLEVLSARGWDEADLCEADALRPETLVPALNGIEVAYYLVHALGAGAGRAASDGQAAINFRNAAAAAGVGRIVYLTGPASSDSRAVAAEGQLARTADILRGGTVPVTQLRVGLLIGAGSAPYEIIRSLVEQQPILVMPGWTERLTQPIALDDLLGYLVALAGMPETAGCTLDVAGPEVLRFSDLLRQCAEFEGCRRHYVSLPFDVPGLSALWLGVVADIPLSFARPFVAGLLSDRVADTRRTQELMPRKLLTFREALQIASQRDEPLPARWVEGVLAFQNYSGEHVFYSKVERRAVRVKAPAEEMWRVVETIGGKNGYFFGDFLWRLRGAVDRAIGGVGMFRGRRHATMLRPGDAVDFWRVVAVEAPSKLTLAAEMKLPGEAILQFEVTPIDSSACRLVMEARFHPSGIPGLLYWYALLPIHSIIFRRMPDRLGRRAENEWKRRRPAH